MAKVVKGGRRSNDPLGKYSVYSQNGRVVRRAANPEGYQHSGNQRVKRTRDAMRRVMVRFSSLDIYTRQMYTEGTALNNPILRDYLLRRLIYEIKKRPPKFPPITPYPDPSPYIPPNPVPIPGPLPNPNITPEHWPYPEWHPWPNKTPRPGPNSYGHDHLPQEIPNPSRDHPTPGPPSDIPNPTDDRRLPQPTPVYIVVEVDPSGLSGEAYDLYLEAKSSYRQVKRWVHDNKKVVMIIVIVGLVILFVYTFGVGGVTIGSGSHVLADASLMSYAPMLMPIVGARPIEWVKDWFYKKLVIHWAKNLNIAALNMTRGWYCYKEVEDYGTDIYYKFYEGPDEKHKGAWAGTVHLRVDLENRTADLHWYCGDSKDNIWIYKDDIKLGECNPPDYPPDLVWLWNNTKKVVGEHRVRVEWPKVIYEFEDRPGFGDGDYNDAYAILTYDKNGNLTDIQVKEGSHGDELYIYWRQYLIAHFP